MVLMITTGERYHHHKYNAIESIKLYFNEQHGAGKTCTMLTRRLSKAHIYFNPRIHEEFDREEDTRQNLFCHVLYMGAIERTTRS